MRIFRGIAVFLGGLLAGRRLRKKRALPARSERARENLPFWVYGWKGFFKRFAVLLPFLALAGFLAAASGVISIKASSGHFAITRWFLEFSMERSVSTYSMGIDPPPLEDADLVLKGAGHYETGCRPCHGGVGDLQPGVPKQMTPQPPSLPSVVPEWSAAELFYIVKHGVKFTGMPAFPSLERDDEVWSVVAFLQRLPDMTVPEYQRLVFADRDERGASRGDEPAGVTDTTAQSVEQVAVADSIVDSPPAAPIGGLPTDLRSVVVSCRRCHGEGGRGRELSAFPRLAGQKADYLYAALFAYSSGERHSGMMEPIAAALTAEEMRAIATYFEGASVQPALRSGGGLGGGDAADDDAGDGDEGLIDAGGDTLGVDAIPQEIAESISRGREIARQGIPAEKIPSCQDCHGPGAVRTNPFYPALAGQYAEYLLLQLKLFKTEKRGGSAYAHLMQRTASLLSEDQMRDVALYYESLGGEPITPIASYTDALVPTEH